MNPQTKETAHSPELTDADRRQILAIAERHGPQTVAGDWEAMNEDYADDVLVMMPGLPDMRGKAALRKFQDGFPPIAMSELHIDHLDGCGDVAYARLRYRYVLEEGGNADSGRGIWILRKGGDGRWRVTLDISNSERESAPPGSEG